ncbi:MAG: tyrosine-type recombinase/integrase [Dysosmobacter welbionis]
MAINTVYKNFKKIAAEIGRPDARVHDLRHTFAVMSLQEGDDVKTVQSNLGHATASFTLDVYGHVSEKMKKESAARMEAFIESVKRHEKRLQKLFFRSLFLPYFYPLQVLFTL